MVTVSRECVDSPLVRTERFGEILLTQRLADQYVDATDICRQTGKKLAHYLENKGAQEVMAVLAGDIGIPTSQLVQVRRGNAKGDNSGVTQGTWLHPDLAIDFARWACPRFALQMARWVRELLTTGRVELTPPVPDPRVERLLGQLEHMQQQLDRLSAMPAVAPMLSPATPRYTLRERLRWHGWHACPRGMRRAITKHVKDLIEKFCDDVPHQAGGTAGGGPLVFQGGQLMYLDEAILHYRACAERARLADEQRQPTLPFPKEAVNPAA